MEFEGCIWLQGNMKFQGMQEILNFIFLRDHVTDINEFLILKTRDNSQK